VVNKTEFALGSRGADTSDIPPRSLRLTLLGVIIVTESGIVDSKILLPNRKEKA